MTRHNDRLQSLITNLAADFFNRQSDRTSMVTVTHTEIKNNGRAATIFLTIFPPESEAAALAFAKRKRSELKDFIGRQSRLKFMPHINIELVTEF